MSLAFRLALTLDRDSEADTFGKIYIVNVTVKGRAAWMAKLSWLLALARLGVFDVVAPSA